MLPTWLAVLMLLAVAGPVSAHLTGAVWTTAADGAKVDANIYDQKCPPEVDPCVTPPLVPFLSGGPNFASPTRWVPDGLYFFQVTDPSGKVLLSTDEIEKRLFEVYTDGDGRKHVVYLGGTHVVCYDFLNGNETIALCPFLDTPNNGGEYKLWITRVDDYDETMADSWSGGCSYGFIPRYSKTDNFKVRQPELAAIWGEKVDDQGDPVEGVHIILYEVQKVKGEETLVRIADTCTNAAGEFSFANLGVGKYAVDEDLDLSQPPIPPGCIDYSDWERVSPAGPIYFNITRGDLGSKGKNATPGAVIYIGQFVNQPMGPPPLAALQGVKFLDVNGNGLLDADPAEIPLPDWAITLEQKTGNGSWQQALDADGVLIDPFVTGADGAFSFGNLSVEKVYRVCEYKWIDLNTDGMLDYTYDPVSFTFNLECVPPGDAGWLQTAPSSGNPGPYVVAPPEADVTVDAVDQCFVIAIGATAPDGTTVSDLRFGNKLAKLCVQKLQQRTGTPLAGWEFTLYEADGVTLVEYDGLGNPVSPVVTDATGTACWGNLLAGDYVVKETAKLGWLPVSPDAQFVTVPAGGTASVTFTNYAPCIGLTPGYWKNWRNHYTDAEFELLLPGTIAGTIAEADAIFDHWDANPENYLTILRAFLVANQLTINLTQHPELPNPSGGSLVPECVLEYNGTVLVLGDVIEAALAILADPGAYTREEVLIVKNWLEAFATAYLP